MRTWFYTEKHRKACLESVHLFKLSEENNLETTTETTSSLVEKVSGINNLAQAIFSLFNIILSKLKPEHFIVLFNKLTTVFNNLFNLFDKHVEVIDKIANSETLVEIYDLFVVQLFEMFLAIFLVDEEHRKLITTSFFSFVESVLTQFVDNKCEFSLSVPKSVVLSFLTQMLKIQDDAVYFQMSDYIYTIVVDMILTKDDDTRELIRSVLSRHRKNSIAKSVSK
ncbi:hypothetical protein EIN_275510 [Entamoeba invadens IP1]|uniref:Uncharacterized protein n=1 Tax=Entamoeba invadens IP1 TaxID=370355 RepID=L7FM85_ENTIV|nr:hypothetical protein EIN_275510 [Entamoeba invadens IP1]ELP89919.1 hypothetical protein EIN_275510 [Entamoeba invadens IP1]|eukprot:XP_004256690.1 hypothetical protein EIN_275510 [Entamoeba invadens IP1]